MDRYEVRCSECALREISTYERCSEIANVHTQVTKHRKISIVRYGVPLMEVLAT
jgi:hypothetical protein